MAYAERTQFAVADAADARAVDGTFDLILCDVALLGRGRWRASRRFGTGCSGGVCAAGGAQRDDPERGVEAAGAGRKAGVFDLLAGTRGV